MSWLGFFSCFYFTKLNSRHTIFQLEQPLERKAKGQDCVWISGWKDSVTTSCRKGFDISEGVWNCNLDGNYFTKYGSASGIHGFRDSNNVTVQAEGADGRLLRYKAPCFRCGRNHSTQTCRCTELNCFYCKQKGYIADECPIRNRSQSRGEKQGFQPIRRDILVSRGQVTYRK